jgi:hypothetical protein
VHRVTRTVVVALVVIATARLAGAQGAKLAEEFKQPSQGFAILRAGHGPPITYGACKLTYAWTMRQLDGTVVGSGVEQHELNVGRQYKLWITLTGRQVGETRRDWTGSDIIDVTIQKAQCPSLPNGLRIEPGAVVRQQLRGALDVAAPPAGGSPVVWSVKLDGAVVVVDYLMSESLEEWTQRYPLAQIEARLAHAQAQLDRKAGRSADAVRELRHALAVEPTLSDAAVDLAELLLAADKHDDAVAAVAETARTRPAWLYRQILERPALAPLRDLPALQPALASKGDARWDGEAFTVAYSRALDMFAVQQSTDSDGNGGAAWVDFIGVDGRLQTTIRMFTCEGMDCPVLPHSVDLLNRMLADLGFVKGEAAQNSATDGTQGCRLRFPSVHLGVVCGATQVRIVKRDAVLIEQPLGGERYRFAVRFPGIIVLGTWDDGYGHQTITGIQVLRSSTIP